MRTHFFLFNSYMSMIQNALLNVHLDPVFSVTFGANTQDNQNDAKPEKRKLFDLEILQSPDSDSANRNERANPLVHATNARAPVAWK